jgi:hypothetical protein
MVTKMCYDVLGVVPEYISTYDARKYAFPSLMQPNTTGKHVLFGGMPKDVDKKKVIWEKVNERQPEINWILDKKGQLKKENFDMSDAYTVALAFAHLNEIFE